MRIAQKRLGKVSREDLVKHRTGALNLIWGKIPMHKRPAWKMVLGKNAKGQDCVMVRIALGFAVKNRWAAICQKEMEIFVFP